MSLNEKNYPVVSFGEILIDVLPGAAVPGGAPMNVAYHLKRLGVDPGLITRVGLDDPGKKLIQLMERNGISTDFFQMDFELNTGKVIATVLENKEVVYDIQRPVAWDNIQWDEYFEPLLASDPYFVFGSLVARSEVSRNTLSRLLEMAKFKVLDLNLRPPFYSRELIEKIIKGVSLLKLNLAELELVTGWFSPYKSETERIKILQDRFNIPNIVVTRGGDGVVFNKDGIIYEHPGFVVELADTIGSGDAFLAAFITKFLQGASPPEVLEFASALGALVASYTGPCPDYGVEEIDSLIRAGSSQKI
jgi:fructokinase